MRCTHALAAPIALALCALSLAACGGSSSPGAGNAALSSPAQQQVAGVVRHLLGALAAGDVAAACTTLDPAYGQRLGCGTQRADQVLSLVRAQPDPAARTRVLAILSHAQLRYVDVRMLTPQKLGATVNVVWGSDPKQLSTNYRLTIPGPGPDWRIDDIELGPPAGQD
ncbi:MAG: hypothetical protein ACR2HD_09230 [Solirubrobacteraceae bacterium]|nr:MAG: hypothetical protein DLM63_05305 [Solirubrobacterales bacterium]